MIRITKRTVVAAALFGLFATIAPAHSQDRSGEVLKQLEKKETIPAEKPLAPPVIQQEKESEGQRVKESESQRVGESESQKAKQAEGEKIFVKQYKIQGAALIDEASLAASIASYQNKQLSISEIIKAADTITGLYRQKGFLAAYAYIPAQDIKDGIVLIQVMEGKTGGITITGNRNYKTQFILGHLQKTKQEPSIKEQTLERALMLLNDYPSLNVNASLKPGKEPGTTDVAVTATDTYPISASLTYDNFGTKTLSKHRLSLVLDKGNTITDGDDIRLSGVTGLDRIDLDKLSYGRIDYIFPVDYNGTKLGVYYANSLYEAGKELTPLQIKGKADVAGVFLTNPLIKKADTTLTAKLGFDYKDVYDYMLDSTRSEDKIRTISLGINYDTTDSLLFNQTSRNILGFSYYRGINSIMGGSDRNDTKISRLHADGDFNKFTLDIIRIQRLTQYNHLIIKASGQYSAEPLFVAEQYTIGGAGSIRGFAPSAYSGDSGYTATIELQTSPILPDTIIFNNQKLGDTIKLAIFADNGAVQRNDRQPGEAEDDYLTSIGVGIRIYAGKTISARLDQAWPEKNGKYNNKNAETYLQMTASF